MAKTKRRGGRGSVSAYFRPIFEQQPELLHSKSNAELLQRWLADHPRKTRVSGRVKQNLASLKSHMRKQLREKEGGGVGMTGVAASESRSVKGRPTMERLEEYIDECLTLAKNLDRRGLESVISTLRRARNEVVWKMGQ